MKEINVVVGTDGTFIVRLLSEDGVQILETAQTFNDLIKKLDRLTKLGAVAVAPAQAEVGAALNS